MGLAEDLKALQELRDKGELTESAYASARDAAIGKQQAAHPPAVVTSKPLIGKPVKVLIAILILFAGFLILGRIMNQSANIPTSGSTNFFHTPQTLTDETENVPAASWKALNYGLPQGGKLEVTIHVVNGNPMDVFLIPADQLDTMKRSEWGNVRTYGDFNATKTKEYHRTAQLGPGNYYLVLRDTSLGVLSARATDVSVKTVLTP